MLKQQILFLNRCFSHRRREHLPLPVTVPASKAAPAWRARFLPAHDLMGEEDAAHLRILVLAFVQDGLKSQTE